MNGKQAKAIRRVIYGDLSHRQRLYTRMRGAIVNHPDSPRAKYQIAKRIYKESKHG